LGVFLFVGNPFNEPLNFFIIFKLIHPAEVNPMGNIY
jgi:hypothetical protein